MQNCTWEVSSQVNHRGRKYAHTFTKSEFISACKSWSVTWCFCGCNLRWGVDGRLASNSWKSSQINKNLWDWRKSLQIAWWQLENLATVVLKDGGACCAMACFTNCSPFTRVTKPHVLNHRACSIHGSSDGSQSLRPPSQWKHRTWSPLPRKHIAC